MNIQENNLFAIIDTNYQCITIDNFIFKYFKDIQVLKGTDAYAKRRYVLSDDFFIKERMPDFMQSKYYHLILFHYSSHYHDLKNDVIDRFLIENYEKEFIDSIRLSQSYLIRENFEKLSKLPYNKDHKIHIRLWAMLAKRECQIWNEINDKYERIKDNSIDFKVGSLVAWIELKRFEFFKKNNPESELQYISRNTRIYNFCISYIISNTSDFSGFNLKNVEDNLFKEISSLDQKCRNFFEAVNRWVKFNESIDLYSFDLNCLPCKVNVTDFLFKYESEKLIDKWENDGKGYQEYRQQKYLDRAVGFEYLNGTENNPYKTIGKNEIEKDINFYIDTSASITYDLLKKSGFDKFKISNSFLDLEKIICPFVVYSGNRYFRYELPLNEYRKCSRNLDQNLDYVYHENGKINNTASPVILFQKEDFIKLNLSALKNIDITDEEMSNIINLCSFHIKPNLKFNRFRPFYDINSKPFLLINNHIFSPTIFFAHFDFFYGSLQLAFEILAKDNKLREESNCRFEKEFVELFNKNGFSAIQLPSPNAENSGDIDIIVNDRFKNQWLIQLKRTQLKPDLWSQYKDLIETDLKASKQLNDAIENEYYEDYVNKDFTKMIVSTSFERRNEKIDDCLKINYYELYDFLTKNAESNVPLENLQEILQSLLKSIDSI